MKPFLLIALAGALFVGTQALISRQPVDPRPVTIAVKVHHGGRCVWKTTGAYEVTITDMATWANVGGDWPPQGSITLPSGSYRFTATGDRNRFADAVEVVP